MGVNNSKHEAIPNRKSKSITKPELESMIDSIEDQLQADARYVESLLTNTKFGSFSWYTTNVLRIHDPVSNSLFPVVIPIELRVECLLTRIKVPFTLQTMTNPYGERVYTFSYVWNVQ